VGRLKPSGSKCDRCRTWYKLTDVGALHIRVAYRILNQDMMVCPACEREVNLHLQQRLLREGKSIKTIPAPPAKPGAPKYLVILTDPGDYLDTPVDVNAQIALLNQAAKEKA